MLHKETVETGTLDLIHRLMDDERLKEFTLVGGTALSLQIGHRKSVDIDLFNKREFDSELLKVYLTEKYEAINIRYGVNSVLCFINDVKVDMISHRVPDTRPTVYDEGIRMASLEDIGAMKLNYITRDGSRFKDFVDMHVLLSHKPLEVYGAAFENKYDTISRAIAYYSLTYHKDIELDKLVFMGKELTLPIIAERLQQAVHNPSHIFDKYVLNLKQSQELKQDLKKEQQLEKQLKQYRQRPDSGRGYRM
ncbi:MAG: nucleotidyl transferase AbiEii/AbiGii toxin family protein [Sediminibacterium sp.]|nr:nucleotidyl transferase AbiEii/AbiGii toxin family protein [Sediminibacterium sp.]